MFEGLTEGLSGIVAAAGQAVQQGQQAASQAASLTKDWPNTASSPPSNVSTPAMAFITLDLPAPSGPISPNSSPRATLKSSAFTASVAP